MRAFVAGVALLCALLVGCQRVPQTSGKLPHRGYLWQREWTPAVGAAAVEAAGRLDGVVLLGGEVVWDGGVPRLIKASIRWEALRDLRRPLSLALRIAPFAGPFAPGDANARFLRATTLELLGEAVRAGVELAEFQLDFDCAQSRLNGYATWLRMLRESIRPLRFVITALPAWLKESAFVRVLDETDGYVLQVHSVPTAELHRAARLCDPELARRWVAAAARLGRPFSVALPTYRCTAGFDAAGKLLGIAMDAAQPAWPPGTQTLEFGAEESELAGLVREWESARPAALRELLWYRVPVSTDTRNWRWPTFAAVMEGRKPRRQWEAVATGDGPTDLALTNVGESDQPLRIRVVVRWEGAPPEAAEALPGWALRPGRGEAVFETRVDVAMRLPPGASRGFGWLRFASPTKLVLEVQDHEETAR